MGSLSIWHWLIVLVIVMLVFGTKKLRNIGTDLGGAVRGFKDGIREGGEKAADTGAAPQVSGKTVEGEVKSRTESKARPAAFRFLRGRPMGARLVFALTLSEPIRLRTPCSTSAFPKWWSSGWSR